MVLKGEFAMSASEPASEPASELVLRFATPDLVNLSYAGTDSGEVPFASPVTDQDRRDLSWYVETYGARSLGEADDAEAQRIKARLPEIGKALFAAVFGEDRGAQRLFDRFQDVQDGTRVLTIETRHAPILSLPWELLHDPTGVFLFRERPRISVRRRISGATRGRAPFVLRAKPRLHLLFVVSRPDGAGFLDPRADAAAVIQAVMDKAPGRVAWEVLRPATLDALAARLDDATAPAVDILHFDGHGVFHQVSAHGAPGPRHPAAEVPVGGCLLFEQADGSARTVSAEDLAKNLFRARVGLVVLSACQSAALDAGGDPMASVAGGLTATGIPAILAMTHAVLAVTTRQLFGQFYASLAKSRGIAGALDDARAWLDNNPEKFEVQRGSTRRMLKLDDWFLPALFQSGAETPMLTRNARIDSAVAPRDNLRPVHEAGFFGRRREIWQIERWFAAGTLRITLTGFGGVGKTELAQEAARWLLLTGPWRRAVLVDYAQVQSDDALGVALSTIGTVLGETLDSAEAAGRALAAEPSLLILDNLETPPREGLGPLLDAAAAWSRQGLTRVLLTTRTPDLGHPEYRSEGTRVHRRIALGGLGSAAQPDDALDWFRALRALPGADPGAEVPPPGRDDLIALFDQVDFHPLSIAVLAQQLRTRPAQQLGARLTALLDEAARSGIAAEGTPASLIASLRLSLDRLGEEERRVLGRLGVFQGGAMEPDLLAVTGLGDWPALRRHLESAALIQAESIPGVGPAYLRFHPTLAPLLWEGLDAKERDRLTLVHRRRYGQLAEYLYQSDSKVPDQARAVARRELPNLLQAVDRAVAAGDPNAVQFVNSVNLFLRSFGRTREAERLTRQAESAGDAVGSEAWFLAQSNRFEQLLSAGRAGQAAECCRSILRVLGETPSYRLALTLDDLGRCYREGGRPDEAEARFRRGLGVAEALVQDDRVRHLWAALHMHLAAVVADQGRFGEARASYGRALEVLRARGDLRSEGVVLEHIGLLALREGNLPEAARRYQEALTLSQRLREPAMEATAQHQLGRTYHEAGQWEQAERHYRDAAAIREPQGDLRGAAQTWNQLALICMATGRPEAAEAWYLKAIEGGKASGDNPLASAAAGNLAALLLDGPNRLAEARQLAEEALAIRETLDPGAAEIWKTYDLLARIADRESRSDAAAGYRRLARESKARFAGTARVVRGLAPLIAAVALAAGGDPKARSDVDEVIRHASQAGGEGAEFAQSMQRILAGERDPQSLCQRLSFEYGPVVEAILHAIADPAALAALLGESGPSP